MGFINVYDTENCVDWASRLFAIVTHWKKRYCIQVKMEIYHSSRLVISINQVYIKMISFNTRSSNKWQHIFLKNLKCIKNIFTKTIKVFSLMIFYEHRNTAVYKVERLVIYSILESFYLSLFPVSASRQIIKA